MPGRLLHAVALPAGPALLDALADALGGGPALLPIDPRLPEPALRRLLAALRPDALVMAGGTARLADGAPVAGDVSVVIATSGSTGEPKGVELSAAALRHSASATLRRLGARPGDRWLSCLPPSGIAGLQVLVRSLVSGTEPVVVDRFSTAAVAGAPGEHIAVVPTMLRRLLEAGVDLARFSSVLVGGAALPTDLLDRARAAGARIVTTYGMTETAGGCVYDGKPLDEVRISIAGGQTADNGPAGGTRQTVRRTTEVGPGAGRISIAGPVLAGGYRLRPDLTASAFAAGRLLTQDVGRWTTDGRLEVLGRVDDMIVTGGVNVSAAAARDLLATYPGVTEVAVVGTDHDEWGQQVVAVVVPGDAQAPPTLAGLRDHVLGGAAPAIAPRELVVVDALPTLPSGKLDRLALQELARHGVAERSPDR